MRVLRGQRSHIAAAQGVTEDKYDDIIDFRRSDRYDGRELAALRWAEAIAWDPGSADDDLWAELHQHFSEPELVELGYFIGLTMGQQRFLKTLGIKHGELGTASLAWPGPGRRPPAHRTGCGRDRLTYGVRREAVGGCGFRTVLRAFAVWTAAVSAFTS